MKFYLYLLVGISFLTMFFSACNDDEETIESVETQIGGHVYVDLGLPSGTLWATEDVKVNGTCFFAWGETEPKESYTVATYHHAQGQDMTLTKYCTVDTNGAQGFVDGVLTLQASDDVAQVHWGHGWCMPMWEEWQELYEHCTWETVMVDENTCVFVATSKHNGRQIEFPATGAMQGDKMLYAGKGSYYWSSTLSAEDCMYAAGLSLSQQSINFKQGKRPMGHCVRPVVPGERILLRSVDLGLPSGLKWASANIGALQPEDDGLLYAWGETKPKSYYDYTTYIHCKGTPKSLTKYNTCDAYGLTDGKTCLEDVDDVAVQAWGNGWRMPTRAEMEELMTMCTWTFSEKEEKKFWIVTGPNGQSLVWPLAGTQWQETLEFVALRGFYWTSTLDEETCQFAHGLFLNPKSFSWGTGFQRASGRSVRAVHE